MKQGIALVLFGVALGCLALYELQGTWVNLTESLPRGLYRSVNHPVRKGELVVVRTPATNPFLIAYARGYIVDSDNPAYRFECLIKRVAAMEGDVITVNGSGVTVNGQRLRNSQPLGRDEEGNSMAVFGFAANGYVLQKGEMLLMTESPTGFDGRYFGTLSTDAVLAVTQPLFTIDEEKKDQTAQERHVDRP